MLKGDNHVSPMKITSVLLSRQAQGFEIGAGRKAGSGFLTAYLILNERLAPLVVIHTHPLGMDYAQ